MSEIWGKLRQELDRAGKVALEAVDEGKLRLDIFRLKQAADRNAEALGYEFYRARKEGREPGTDLVESLMMRLAEQDARLSDLEGALRKERDADGGAPVAPPGDVVG